MTVEITVRGSAEQRWPAEVATVFAAVEARGEDRAAVMAEATEAHRALTTALAGLDQAGALVRWSAGAVRVVTQRDWLPDGRRGPLLQIARLDVQAQFIDVEALSRFLDDWSGDERIEVGQIVWGLTEEHRRERTAQVRTAAVADAVTTAQAYADALGAGQVVATHLADPGLLGPGEPQPRAMMAMAESRGPSLDLAPEDVVIRCEVDARFRAG